MNPQQAGKLTELFRFQIKFDFYQMDEASSLIKKLPTAGVSAQELKNILSPHRITATEAVLLSQQQNIGHIVQIIRGIKK